MLSKMPFLYKMIGGLVLLVSIVAASYLYGYSKGEAISKVAIAEFVAKKEKISKDLKDTNIEINDKETHKYHEKVKVIYQKQIVYRDVIKDKVSSNGPLSEGWVYAHDMIALGKDINPEMAKSTSPSPYSDIDGLSIINNNYSSCEIVKERLRRLQSGLAEWNAKVVQGEDK